MNPAFEWYARQSRDNPDLFRAVFDFNKRPHYWVHEEVMNRLTQAPVIKVLATSAHGGRHLSHWLSRELGLDQAGLCWDFKEPRRRLALLGTETLTRLACFCGAALGWQAIAAVIGRAEIQQIKQTLGDEAHRFALRRARLVVPQAEALAESDGVSLARRALHRGWQLLLRAMADEDPAVSRRVRLKLPADVPELPAADAEVRAQAWRQLRKIAPDALTEEELKCFA
jgi:hypothetical protein